MITANQNRFFPFNYANNFSLVDKKNRNRAVIDLNMRTRMLELEPVVSIPTMFPPAFYTYWEWYANAVGKSLRYEEDTNMTPATFGSYSLARNNALMYKGGSKSILAKHLLHNTDIIHLRYAPKATNLTGLLAIIGAGMGYSNTYIGTEKYTKHLYNEHSLLDRSLHIEYTEEWMERWNEYAYPCVVQSVTGAWSLDELLYKMFDLNEMINISNCEEQQQGHWCGKCIPCMSTWITCEVAEAQERPQITMDKGFLIKFKELYKVLADNDTKNLYTLLAQKYNSDIVSVIDRELNLTVDYEIPTRDA